MGVFFSKLGSEFFGRVVGVFLNLQKGLRELRKFIDKGQNLGRNFGVVVRGWWWVEFMRQEERRVRSVRQFNLARIGATPRMNRDASRVAWAWRDTQMNSLHLRNPVSFL